MPLLEPLPPSEKIDCSEESGRSSSLMCRLLPLGLHYSESQVDTSGGANGQIVRVLFSTQSSGAIVYVTVVLIIYIVVFVALVFTSYWRNIERNRKRRLRRNQQLKRLADTVVECDTRGHVKCQTNETLVNATCV